ncbi:MAG: hypothetical protein NTX50_29345 [Candidatus Sumerlaeota bacterium]|nr:hypothetical protein [Candidatus Sumerlaeota bacterium]
MEARHWITHYWDMFDHLQNIPDKAGPDMARLAQHFLNPQKGSWDIFVALATLQLNKCHLAPASGLIRNIGLDAGANFQSAESLSFNRNVCEAADGNAIAWLDDIHPQDAFVKKLSEYILQLHGVAQSNVSDVREGFCLSALKAWLRWLILKLLKRFHAK